MNRPDSELNQAKDDSWRNETVVVDGVEGEVPKYWSDGREVIYYCKYCQTPPEIDDNDPKKFVVSIGHDDCVNASARKVLTQLEENNRKLQSKIDYLTIQNEILALGLGLDPDKFLP